MNVLLRVVSVVFPFFFGGLKLFSLPPPLGLIMITIAMLILCQNLAQSPTQCLLILNNTPGLQPLSHTATLLYTVTY